MYYIRTRCLAATVTSYCRTKTEEQKAVTISMQISFYGEVDESSIQVN